jgi:SSS family solute:Na+ symporter
MKYPIPLADSAPHVANLDVGIIVVYFVALFALGIYMSRRQRSEEEYFLGGRKTPWFLAGVSVIASLLSTLTYLATPGEMIGHGTGYFYSQVALIAVIPAVTLIIIPALMRLPVTSVYDCLERRYGLSARMTGALVFLITRLLWVGLIIFTASTAVAKITGWPMEWIVCVIGAVTIFYTSIGGLEAVIWADVAQFTLLFGGAAFIPFFVAWNTGSGPSHWWTLIHEAHKPAPVFSLDPTIRITIVGICIETFLWNFCTHGSDQIAAQRYLSTPSVASARRSVWVFSMCSLFVTVLLALCGMAIFYFYNVSQKMSLAAIHRDSDSLVPKFIGTQLPTGISGLMLAAILASAMSCLSSGINSISTVVVTDFIQRFTANRREKVELLLAKLLVVVAGVIGVDVALLVKELMAVQTEWRLVDLIARMNHLFVAPLGALFLVGILSRRVGTVAALAGFFLGVLASAAVSFSGEALDLVYGAHVGHTYNVKIAGDTISVRLDGNQGGSGWIGTNVDTGIEIHVPDTTRMRHAPISFTWIMPVSFVVSLLSSYLLGFLFEAPQASQLIGLYAFGARPGEASAAEEEPPVVQIAPSDL